MKGYPKLKIFIIIFVALLITIPLFINKLYLCGYINNTPINTFFDASDLLAYWGAIVSAISAAYLGYVSYSLNKRVLALTEADTERNKFSTIILESVGVEDSNWNVPIQGNDPVEKQLNKKGFTKIANIGFHVRNLGPAPLSKIIVHYVDCQNVDIAIIEYIYSLAPNCRKNEQIPLINGQVPRLIFEFISCYGKSSYASCNIAPAGIGVQNLDTIVDYQITDSIQTNSKL